VDAENRGDVWISSVNEVRFGAVEGLWFSAKVLCRTNKIDHLSRVIRTVAV